MDPLVLGTLLHDLVLALIELATNIQFLESKPMQGDRDYLLDLLDAT
jgi:hypothetical protein